MTYLTKSAEAPIGKVLHLWWEYELQELKANVPHIHSILWLEDNDGTAEGLQRILNCIRASISCLTTSSELRDYLAQGILSLYDEFIEMLEILKKILTHKHHCRCLIPIAKRPDSLDQMSVHVIGATGNKALTAAS